MLFDIYSNKCHGIYIELWRQAEPVDPREKNCVNRGLPHNRKRPSGRFFHDLRFDNKLALP